MRVEWHDSNYTRKSGVRRETGIYTISFTKKVDLASVKSDVDKLDSDKVTNYSCCFEETIDAVDNSVVKERVFNRYLMEYFTDSNVLN